MTGGTAQDTKDPAGRRLTISYSGPDRAWAEWTAWTLAEEGFRAELALWDWRLGERLEERLEDAGSSGLLVLLLSPGYLESPWAVADWGAVLTQRDVSGRLLPVQVEPLPAGALPPALSTLQSLRIFGLPEKEAAARLIAAVRRAEALDAHTRLIAAARDRGLFDGADGPVPPGREEPPRGAGQAADGSAAHTPGARAVPRHRTLPGLPAVAEPAPRLPGTQARPGVSNVPAGPPGVSDRESLLQRVRQELISSHFASLPVRRGPDGVGAADIAREYAGRFHSQYDLVWWVDAADPDRVRSSYAELARLLGREGNGEDDFAALFAHLGDRTNWLIVFDRATAPERLAELLPPDSGHLLVLPADTGWPAGARRYRTSSPQPTAGDIGHAPTEPSRPLRILAVATEWASRLGGLSTFNRCLCRALAATGAEVYCLVPEADREEEADARRHGVVLVESQDPPVWTGALSLLRRPASLTVVPDVILGHGRVTGRAAQLLRDQHFADAQLAHIIHTLPYEIEFLKEGRADDPAQRADDRTWVELALAGAADHAVVVGPLLHNKYARHFPRQGPLDSTTLLCVNPGFDATEAGPRAVPAGDPAVLVFGRAEDVRLKGLDLAAQALGRFVRRTDARKLDFVVRGLAVGQSGVELRDLIDRHAGSGTLTVHTKPYRTDSGILASDLTAASLVLLPSRSEAFGLSAVEAIAAGTPVLVSSASGLGVLLRETLGVPEAAHHVVETRDEKKDAERWSLAVERVLGDRKEAFRRAALLRDQLRDSYTWRDAAASLLSRLRDRTPS